MKTFILELFGGKKKNGSGRGLFRFHITKYRVELGRAQFFELRATYNQARAWVRGSKNIDWAFKLSEVFEIKIAMSS